MTQWIGGMGIIVLTIAILPLVRNWRNGTIYCWSTWANKKDKIHPRIKETVKRLWIILS